MLSLFAHPIFSISYIHSYYHYGELLIIVSTNPDFRLGRFLTTGQCAQLSESPLCNLPGNIWTLNYIYCNFFYNIRTILLNIHTHCHNTIQLFTKSWDISLLHGWWPSTGPVVLVNLVRAASSLGSLWWQQPKNTHISLQYLLISQSPKGYNA